MCKTSQKLKVCYVIAQNAFGLATIDQLHNKNGRLEQNTAYPNVCNTVIVLCSLSLSDAVSHYIMEKNNTKPCFKWGSENSGNPIHF